MESNMKTKRITVQMGARVNMGDFERVDLSIFQEVELGPEDNAKAARRKLHADVQSFVEEQVEILRKVADKRRKKLPVNRGGTREED